MRKLTLSILAASIALVPAAALADQHRGGGGHRGGGHHGGGGHRGGGFFGGGFFGGGFWGGGGGGQTVVVIGGDGQVMHPGRNWQRRLRRGHVIHPYWYGPQFHLGDWHRYGFADPGPDRRWIRYYDDAYLVDRGGRVIERREDFEWERYADEWEMEEGIPRHRRHGGHHDDRDYSEHHDDRRHGGHGGHGGGWDMSGYGHGGTVVHGGPAYGHGGYYGYGYYAYPIVIETTTTYGQTEVIEEYVEVQRPRRRVRSCNCARPRAPAPRPRAPAPRPRPRPPAGERG